MCELFALSASAPLNIRYNLDSFAAEGGERHQNRDGWGIAYTEGRDTQWFREAAPASDSPLDRFLREHSTPHSQVIAHVRRASRGAGALANTHPFRRIRSGRVQNFAHNGTLEGLNDAPEHARLSHDMLGDTDSELAFLLLLDLLDTHAPDVTDIAARFDVFTGFCRSMAATGPANFLWLDGTTLFVHADQRVSETPEGLSPPQPPGLHILQMQTSTRGQRHDCAGLALSDLPDHVTLFASLPLSDADWKPLTRGTVLAVEHGRISHRAVIAHT